MFTASTSFKSWARFSVWCDAGCGSDSLAAYSHPSGWDGATEVLWPLPAGKSLKIASSPITLFSATNFSHQEITQARSPNEQLKYYLHPILSKKELKTQSSKTKAPDFSQTHKIIQENPRRVTILVPTEMQTHFLECWSSNAHLNRLHRMTSGIHLAIHDSREVGLCGRVLIFQKLLRFCFLDLWL